ncbi:hypothetical protein L596_006452 [Steinernema carpocapsae]|uniref:Uncharacterized protein n=1 Tax=Steinernema carpocapsae TaxID=34508 RepID=A0A4U8V2C5_STECR|nr:hypothetical protein L596_006452 [Steinernema carpocapsae]
MLITLHQSFSITFNHCQPGSLTRTCHHVLQIPPFKSIHFEPSLMRGPMSHNYVSHHEQLKVETDNEVETGKWIPVMANCCPI